MKARDRLHDKALAYLQVIEEKLVRAEHPDDPNAAVGLKITVTASDVTFVLEEIYGGRSVISDIPTNVCLIRWKLSSPTTRGCDK